MRFSLLQTASTALQSLALGGLPVEPVLLAQPGRLLFYLGQALLLSRLLREDWGLPRKDVAEVLGAGETETIRLGGLDQGGAWAWAHSPLGGQSNIAGTADLTSLCLLCRLLEPELVFEIGTNRGFTALHLALNAPDRGRVLTLDLPPGPDVPPRLPITLADAAHLRARSRSSRMLFEHSPLASRIECLRGDSAAYDFSPYHGRVDLFFIDGAPSYEYARSDTEQALRCCHPGSVIAWHDYGKAGAPGLTRWLLELGRQRVLYAIPGGSLAFTVLE